MAKSRQALAKWRGRAGAMVYSVRNGQQIISAAPESMTNPRTAAQAAQRMKLAPAATFYRILEGLVHLGFASHTFQGRKYGNENRLRFMQLAMLNNQGPYVPKDTLTLVPGDFQISEGSLPSFTGRVVVDNDTTGPDTDDMKKLGVDVFTADRIEGLANVLGVEVGDQVSVLYFQYLNGTYVPTAVRFIVESGLDLSTLEGYGEDWFFYVKENDPDLLDEQPWGSAVLYADAQAAACVVSQKQENGSFLRSTEYIHVGDDIREKYYTPEAYDIALASYMDGSNVNTNADPYYNNLGDGQVFPGKIMVSPMKVTKNGTTSTIYVFWGQLNNGNNVIFTTNGTSEGNIVYLYNGEATSPKYDGVEGFAQFTLEDITSSKSWAGIVKWGSGFEDQWTSGQKAVRPYPFVEAGEEEENPVLVGLREKYGEGAHVDVSIDSAIFSSAGITVSAIVAKKSFGEPSIFITNVADANNKYGVFSGQSVNGEITEVEVQSDHYFAIENEFVLNGTTFDLAGHSIRCTANDLNGLPTSIDL